MPKPSEIVTSVAALMNDRAQTLYINAAVLPYLNLALNDLQEIFQHNNIPITNRTSAAITIPVGVNIIGFGTTPALPSNLVEIQQLWERATGNPPYIPMSRKDFIPHSFEDESITQFIIWSWENEEIHLVPSTAANDLKIDYIQKIFNTPILIADINVDLLVINAEQYLTYHTASLCSMFIGENETRANTLESLAITALDRELGIPIKGRQSIVTRRRPFMGGYRRSGYV